MGLGSTTKVATTKVKEMKIQERENQEARGIEEWLKGYWGASVHSEIGVFLPGKKLHANQEVFGILQLPGIFIILESKEEAVALQRSIEMVIEGKDSNEHY